MEVQNACNTHISDQQFIIVMDLKWSNYDGVFQKNNTCILYYNFIDKLPQGTSARQVQQWMKWVGDQLGRAGEWDRRGWLLVARQGQDGG